MYYILQKIQIVVQESIRCAYLYIPNWNEFISINQIPSSIGQILKTFSTRIESIWPIIENQYNWMHYKQ